VVVLIWRSFFFEATSGYLNRFLLSTGLFDLLVRMDQCFHWGGIFVPARRRLAGRSAAHPDLLRGLGLPLGGLFRRAHAPGETAGHQQGCLRAAEIDGVNWWTKFTRIELPLIMARSTCCWSS